MTDLDYDPTRPIRRARMILLCILVVCAIGIVQIAGRSGHEHWLKHGSLKEVGAFVADNPHDAESAYQYAYRQVQEGEADKAIKVLETLIKDHPAEPRFTYGMARANALAGRSLQSERFLLKTIEINPRNAVALNDLANMYSEAGLFTEAEALYRKAAAIDPKSIGNSILRSKTLIGLGKLDEAWDCLTRGVAAMPILDEAFPLLTDIAFQKGRLSVIERMCWKRLGMVSVYPFGKVRTSLLRVILADEKRPSRITEAEEQAVISVQDTAPEAAFYVGLAQVRMLQKNWDAAEKAITKALEINSKDVQALRIASELAGRRGDTKGRDEMARQAEANDVRRIVRTVVSKPVPNVTKIGELLQRGLSAEASEFAYRCQREGQLDGAAGSLLSRCHQEALKVLERKAGPIGDELRRPSVGT